MEDKRIEVTCGICGKEMVFTKRITPPVEGLGGLIYRCPTRENEAGCGHLKEVLVVFSAYKQEIFA